MPKSILRLVQLDTRDSVLHLARNIDKQEREEESAPLVREHSNGRAEMERVTKALIARIDQILEGQSKAA